MLNMQILLVASGVVRDVETNNVSIHNLVERIKAERFPALMLQLCVFALFIRDAEDETTFQVAIDIAYRGGESIASADAELKFQDKRRNRLTLTLVNLAFPGPGIVEFRVKQKTEVGSTELGSYPIEIVDQSVKQLKLDTDAD